MEDMIPNGMISISQMSYMPGVTLTYSCEAGFTTDEILETECQDVLFTWSLDDSPPSCKISMEAYFILP